MAVSGANTMIIPAGIQPYGNIDDSQYIVLAVPNAIATAVSRLIYRAPVKTWIQGVWIWGGLQSTVDDVRLTLYLGQAGRTIAQIVSDAFKITATPGSASGAGAIGDNGGTAGPIALTAWPFNQTSTGVNDHDMLLAGESIVVNASADSTASADIFVTIKTRKIV